MKDLLVLLAHLLTTIAKLSRPGAFTGVGFITFNEYLSQHPITEISAGRKAADNF